jgi:hypothetical protein
MIFEADRIHEAVMARFAEMPCVSLVIDAGTIARRHCLDAMVLAPDSNVTPFLSDSIKKPRSRPTNMEQSLQRR